MDKGKTMSTTTKETKEKLPNKELEKDNELLKKQLEDQKKELEAIKELILNMQNNKNINDESPIKETKVEVKETKTDSYDEYEPIRPDRYIRVMSLTPNLLILSAGNGKVFRFPNFGDIKNIVYTDVIQIIHNQYNLAEQGGYYVFNDEVIKVNGLKDAYEKLLDRQGIETLLDKPIDEIRETINSVSKCQREAIVSNVINQMYHGKNVGSSVISLLNDTCDINISEQLDEMQNFENEVAKLEEEK